MFYYYTILIRNVCLTLKADRSLMSIIPRYLLLKSICRVCITHVEGR
jgi:hypothetical protein